MPYLRMIPLVLIVIMVVSCNTQPIAGTFDDVSSQLVAMGPAERAFNFGANKELYQKDYGIFFDAIQDALYTKDYDGSRRYLLEGDLLRASLLIDRRTDEEKGLKD